MSTFNYPFLLNQLSDKGFEHFKSLVFPMLGYQYMTEAEARKIEVCERLYDMADRVPMKSGQKKGMASEAYYEILENHLQVSIMCKPGSIAEGYKTRAFQIIRDMKVEKAVDEETPFEKRLTLFAIFLALLRSIYPDFQKAYATEAQLFVSRKDADILKAFKDSKSRMDITGIFRKSKVQSIQDNDIVYIHNIIMYCILMEIQGEYTKEGNHESMG